MVPFWDNFRKIFRGIFTPPFLNRFWKAFVRIFGGILLNVWRSFLILFRTLRKRLNLTEVWHIPFGSWVGRVPKQSKNIKKTKQKALRKRSWESSRFWIDFGFILDGFWYHFGSEKSIKNHAPSFDAFWGLSLAWRGFDVGLAWDRRGTDARISSLDPPRAAP